jgi:Domain of unknown function (DUF5615)
MLDPEIGVQLRRAGWDVESIQAEHPELLGADDAAVLATATQLGRALLTDNVRHFLPLHEAHLTEHKVHAGLLLAHPRGYPRSKRTIGLWVRGLAYVLERHGSGSAENLGTWLP